MRRLVLLMAAMLGACLSPVDLAQQVVTSCSGDCPFGVCNAACAQVDGGPENAPTPEDALKVYACLKSSARDCAAYTAEHFTIASPPPGAHGGGYCFETAETPSRRLAVEATDAGGQTHDCTSADAGAPCTSLCPRMKRYKVTSADGG